MAEQTEEQVQVGLMIAIPIFLAVNAGLAYIGGRWMNKLSHKSSEDVLTAHYLGGRSFGPWLTLGTMVSPRPDYIRFISYAMCSYVILLTPLHTFPYHFLIPSLQVCSQDLLS